WAILLAVGALLVIGLARTRWGWPADVALVTLPPPRLLVYMLTGLLAALRQPKVAGQPAPEPEVDAATAFTGAVR
ncbi:MAG TPA: hypothetical protein VK831_00405, partial [Candidatus Deferrimicrobiaceae bacterium]|nr:hypothetical protein [Candidatus Deferrimicrobiaceae bacterium]